MAKTNAHNVYVTLGASNHSKTEREENDYYATDPKALELLLELEEFSPIVWECACGEGHLSEVLKKHNYNVISSDLIDRGYGFSGIDFLEQQDTLVGGDIITNPPYKYAKEFVEHAIDLVEDGHRVAMFLRLSFLEGKARRKLFETTPPKIIYVSSGRISCCKNGDFSEQQIKGNSAQAYAWFIWEKGYRGDTIVKWFN